MLDKAIGGLSEATGKPIDGKSLKAEGRELHTKGEMKTYFVRHHAEKKRGWKVEADGARRASSVHRTKPEAVATSCRVDARPQAARMGAPWGGVPRGLRVVAALQPIPEFGRVYAAYGGIFIALALLWGVVVDGFRSDRWDLLGEPRSVWSAWW